MKLISTADLGPAYELVCGNLSVHSWIGLVQTVAGPCESAAGGTYSPITQKDTHGRKREMGHVDCDEAVGQDNLRCSSATSQLARFLIGGGHRPLSRGQSKRDCCFYYALVHLQSQWGDQ